MRLEEGNISLDEDWTPNFALHFFSKQLLLALFFLRFGALVQWLSGRIAQGPWGGCLFSWSGVTRPHLFLNSSKPHRLHTLAFSTTLLCPDTIQNLKLGYFRSTAPKLSKNCGLTSTLPKPSLMNSTSEKSWLSRSSVRLNGPRYFTVNPFLWLNGNNIARQCFPFHNMVALKVRKVLCI